MKVAFHTLGCKVNQYESEAMAQTFRQRGHEIVGERDYADVYVINTCTVTAVADKKSRQYIRRMKKVNPQAIVAVTGCYAQIDPEAVTSIEGVDIVTGTNEKSTLPDYVEDFARRRFPTSGQGEEDATHPQATGVGVQTTDSAPGVAKPWTHIRDWNDLDEYEEAGLVTSAENRTRAYIKIQEGCNRFCSYCVIPYARGSIRSRDLSEILAEARQLIDAGYKEIVLTGINTALYGAEHEDDRGVERVIAALDALPGDFRIRLSSLEPAVVNADYVKRLLHYPKLCHHLHLSAQSGSDRILAAMNRPYDRTGYLQIVEAVRSFDPYYGLSTDLIAGFPGEKEADQKDSESLVALCDFCRTHVFKYSRRPKTKAASMKDQVSPQVKDRRSAALQEAGEKASASFCMKNLGREETVLVEEYLPEENLLTGYAGNYIRVYLRCQGRVPEELLNRFCRVRLTEIFRDGCIGLIL